MQIAKHWADAQQPFESQVEGKPFTLADDLGPHCGAELAPQRDAALSFPDEPIESRPEGFTTRDSSGTCWLNTGEVLIADIDFANLNEQDFQKASDKCLVFLLVCALPLWTWGIAFAWKLYASSALLFLVMAFLHFIIASIAALFLAAILLDSLQRVTPSPSDQLQKRLSDFLARNPDWHLRLYKTPEGARVLALHRTFDAHEPAVSDFFHQMGVDRRYQELCQNSLCFRVRVSPTPWRLGLCDSSNLGDCWRPGLAQDSSRTSWIERYEQLALAYASCRYIESFGSHRIDPKAALVLAWHDELCKAESRRLPIA
jgi:hypothetical protein